MPVIFLVGLKVPVYISVILSNFFISPDVTNLSFILTMK
jgi:hypothetical protein